jgi:hypothetical protein
VYEQKRVQQRVPRDEREARKMEVDLFHKLVLSLDMSLAAPDAPRTATAHGRDDAAARVLKGQFVSSHDYVNVFGPLVLEEIRAELLQERMEHGASAFRAALLRELQMSHEDADFHYFSLALELAGTISQPSPLQSLNRQLYTYLMQ